MSILRGGLKTPGCGEVTVGILSPSPAKASQNLALVKRHLGSDSAAAELKALGENQTATEPGPGQRPDCAARGQSSPLLAVRAIRRGDHPPGCSHPPDVEEEHLGDAQQAGGDGEDKEGDADEDVLGFVPAAQREGGTGEQEETAAQEPLRGAGMLWGAGGGVSLPHPGGGIRGSPALTCRR